MVFFSFLCVIKNEEKFIRQLIDSVLLIQDVELIMVDDNSSDSTWDIICEYQNKNHNVKCLRNPGVGKVDGGNAAFSRACGLYIQWIDGDDFLNPRAYIDLAKKIREEPNAIFILSLDLVNEAGILENKKISNKINHPLVRIGLGWFLLIIPPKASWILPKNLASKIFPLEQGFVYEDFAIAVKIFILRHHFTVSDECNRKLYYYRQHSANHFGKQNDTNLAKKNWRIARNVSALDFFIESLERDKLNVAIGPLRKIVFIFSSKINLYILQKSMGATHDSWLTKLSQFYSKVRGWR